MPGKAVSEGSSVGGKILHNQLLHYPPFLLHHSSSQPFPSAPRAFRQTAAHFRYGRLSVTNPLPYMVKERDQNLDLGIGIFTNHSLLESFSHSAG